MNMESVARKAYEAYRDSAHNRSFDGSPIPQWNEVRESIRQHWLAAVKAVKDALQANEER